LPIINRVADLADEITLWRRDLHENPELKYDVHRTAGIVAEMLKVFGCDKVVPGIGKTGVVGVIHGSERQSGRVLGLRADMDALPMDEITGLHGGSRRAASGRVQGMASTNTANAGAEWNRGLGSPSTRRLLAREELPAAAHIIAPSGNRRHVRDNATRAETAQRMEPDRQDDRSG
jgi:hypothetical protein